MGCETAICGPRLQGRKRSHGKHHREHRKDALSRSCGVPARRLKLCTASWGLVGQRPAHMKQRGVHGPPPCYAPLSSRKVFALHIAPSFPAKTAGGAPGQVISCSLRILASKLGATWRKTAMCGGRLQDGNSPWNTPPARCRPASRPGSTAPHRSMRFTALTAIFLPLANNPPCWAAAPDSADPACCSRCLLESVYKSIVEFPWRELGGG
jgi:hypothetical protein